MGIGGGIVLLAIGAILTFAVHTTVTGFSIGTVGVILMAAGVLAIVLDLMIFMPRRRTTSVVEHRVYDDTTAPRY